MNAYASVQEQGSYTRVCDRHGRRELPVCRTTCLYSCTQNSDTMPSLCSWNKGHKKKNVISI